MNPGELMDHPDLERELSFYNAVGEDIQRTILRLEKGEIVTPEPYQNLARGIPMIQKEYLRINWRAPESILEAMRDWIAIAANILNPQAPPTPPGAVPQMMAGPSPVGPTQGALAPQAMATMPQ